MCSFKGRKHKLGGGGEKLGDTHGVDVIGRNQGPIRAQGAEANVPRPTKISEWPGNQLGVSERLPGALFFRIHLIACFFDSCLRTDPCCRCSNQGG